MRTSRTNSVGLTRCQAHLLFRLTRENTYRSIDDVECVLHFGVVMPWYRLHRAHLQLGDAKAWPSGVVQATFNIIVPTCRLYRLHVGLHFCGGGHSHCGLMLAIRITLPHFPVSSARS